MKQDRQRNNWLIDAALFGGFLGSLWLDLTGVAVHQWLGLAVAVFSGYHLVKHWPWVKTVTRRFFARTNPRARTCYIVDAGLAVGLAAIMVTGLSTSTWLDLGLANYATWYGVHVVASVSTLALLLAKIRLHWRWIVDVARRRIFSSPAPKASTAAQPAAPLTAVPVGRRDFVRLMAGAGAIALLSGANALAALKIDQAESSTGVQTATSVQPASGPVSSSTSDSCTVRCGRRCSYPGNCGRYTDSNNNGRCDLGECLS
jgi:hypothetical protein